MSYCDTATIEKNWFDWIIARAIPGLDKFRKSGILWTKAVGLVRVNDLILRKDNKTFADPNQGVRQHCLLFREPVFFTSTDGEIPDYANRYGYSRINPIKISDLPTTGYCNDLEFITILLAEGYVQEQPASINRTKLLEGINTICNGVSMNFHLNNDEDRLELVNDAMAQILTKLENRKLNYTPGLAPVFNLLTTTIFRCMYSHMNKKRTHKNNMGKLLASAQAGTLPASRSLHIRTI